MQSKGLSDVYELENNPQSPTEIIESWKSYLFKLTRLYSGKGRRNLKRNKVLSLLSLITVCLNSLVSILQYIFVDGHLQTILILLNVMTIVLSILFVGIPVIFRYSDLSDRYMIYSVRTEDFLSSLSADHYDEDSARQFIDKHKEKYIELLKHAPVI